VANVSVLENNSGAFVAFLKLSSAQKRDVYPALHPTFQLAFDVLKTLKSRGYCTYEELAAFVGANENTIRLVCQVLDGEGLIDKSRGKGGCFAEKMSLSLSLKIRGKI
jgi:predicted transcriptional regulator